MTSGMSRKMGISGEEKAEAKGETPHELEPDAEGPGLRTGSMFCQRLRRELWQQRSTPALAHPWLAAQPRGSPVGCGGTAITC
jgi:hypothetical protein